MLFIHFYKYSSYQLIFKFLFLQKKLFLSVFSSNVVIFIQIFYNLILFLEYNKCMSILIAIKNKFHLLFVLLSMTCSIGLFAQDPIFTQFYSNPVYLNPAFSGTHHCPRIVSNYRNQWPNFSGDFITTSITYDQYVDALKG